MKNYVISENFEFTFKVTIPAESMEKAREIYGRNFSECPRTQEDLISACLNNSDPDLIQVRESNSPDVGRSGRNSFDGDPVLFEGMQFALAFIQSETDPSNLTDSGNHADHYFDRHSDDRETLFRILADYRKSLKATVESRNKDVSA
jgi:hypothetical protein